MSDSIDARLLEARSWGDFQALLRRLHMECGSPKYDAVSVRGGLPKSAVSGLIGRNPQRRSSESTTLRFVSACLAHSGASTEATERSVECWRAAWRRLTTQDEAAATGGLAPASLPVPPSVAPAPARFRSVRTRTVLLVLSVALIALLAFGMGALVWQQVRPPAVAAPASATLGDAASLPAKGTCMAGEAKIPDARLKRDWEGVFVCDNDRALMYRWPSVDGLPTALLRTNPSWFICWTRGQEIGGEDVWYYTQGDDALTDPPIPSTWGFVPAADVRASEHPAPGLTRRCSFASRPH